MRFLSSPYLQQWLAGQLPGTCMGRSCASFTVSNNGLVSFEKRVSGYTPKGIPLTDGKAFVAAYWGDVNNEIAGNIYYRQVEDPKLLNRITKDINECYPDIPFNAIWALIATWDHVAYFGSISDKTNTFQCILATDKDTSFVMLKYKQIQWTTGTASGGDPATGRNGSEAQAGFNTGDDKNYFSIPGSRRPEIINITQTSNVHKPGIWIFQVNDFKPTGIPEELLKLTVPVDEEPQSHVEEEPQAPVEQEPQPPVEQEPQPPVEQEPQPPVEQEPQPPVEKEPQPPVEKEPQTPVEKEPEAPIEEKPEAPIEEKKAQSPY
ncbi:alpha-tectorin-like [Sceloporus undulatus]|uniref:alpha-tectorin-like n=1 Tax=Sceloporus undulatus TaxID=8520 RepID=UPI001C4A7A17|nr:alpha-tectorin-like [Sceloporus undulatus]